MKKKKKKEAVVLICKRVGCKNVSGDNKVEFCDKHFNLTKEFLADNPSLLIKEKREIFGIDTPFLTKMMKKKKKVDKDLPPDEQRCCKNNGIYWRCKNVRMQVDAAKEDDDSNVPNNTIYCRQHYTCLADRRAKYKKKRNGDGEATTTTDKECGFANIIGTKLPPDEQRCVRSSGTGWRCKNVKMWVHAEDNGNVPTTSFCQQHYAYHINSWAKKTSADGEAEGGGSGCTTNCSNKRRKRVVSEDDLFADDTEIQPATTSDTSDYDTERTLAAATERWRKMFSELEKRRKKTVVAEGDRSLEVIDEIGTELPATTTSDKSESYNTVTANIGTKGNEVMENDLSSDQTGIQLATSCTSDSDKSIEGGSANIGTMVERTECSGELESLTRTRDPVVELESLEHYKSKCCELSVELEKEKVEFTLQGKLVELDTRITAVTDERKQALADATECWRKMQSDLESRLLRMEKEKSTTGCLESRILILENIVLRMDNFNSTPAGSVETRISKLESLNLRRGDNEIKWKCEADMLSSFEEDPELCMKAVCALYRLLISEDETPDKRLFHDSDKLRVTELAEFLLDGDCNGDLKKSVEDLEIFDSEGIKDCKKLARRYSDPLFSVYQNGEDPYFLPPTTASSHGYQTSKR